MNNRSRHEFKTAFKCKRSDGVINHSLELPAEKYNIKLLPSKTVCLRTLQLTLVQTLAETNTDSTVTLYSCIKTVKPNKRERLRIQLTLFSIMLLT